MLSVGLNKDIFHFHYLKKPNLVKKVINSQVPITLDEIFELFQPSTSKIRLWSSDCPRMAICMEQSPIISSTFTFTPRLDPIYSSRVYRTKQSEYIWTSGVPYSYCQKKQ